LPNENRRHPTAYPAQAKRSNDCKCRMIANDRASFKKKNRADPIPRRLYPSLRRLPSVTAGVSEQRVQQEAHI
jgi:hypothetical protein